MEYNFNYALCFSGLEKNQFSRLNFYNIFDNLSSKLLVSREYHADMYKVHFHIYLQTKLKVKLIQINKIRTNLSLL